MSLLEHAPVLAFPILDVVDGEGVVWFLGQQRGCVEDDERQDHLLQRNLVRDGAVLGEVGGRIDMSSVLPDHLEVGRAKPVLGDRKGLVGHGIGGGCHLRLTEAGPDGRLRAEAVREVHEGLG